MLQIAPGMQNPKKSPRHLDFMKQLKKTTEINYDFENLGF